MDTLFYVLGFLILILALYIGAKIYLPKWGDQNKLFTTVRKGRIKCIKIGEKIKGYYCNLEDLGLAVIRETGEIVPGKDAELENSILWQHFGVVWMGFGAKPLAYNFRQDNGETVEAESIWYKNQTILNLKDVECEGVVRLDLKVQIIIETSHAGFSLNYADWIGAVRNEIASEIRGYIARKTSAEIFNQKAEDDGELKKEILRIYGKESLINKLKEDLGQIVVDVSLVEVDFAADFKAIKEAEKRAQEQRKADTEGVRFEADKIKIIAEAELEAAEKEAEGIKKIGEAENIVIEKTSSILGQAGASNLYQAREIRKFKGNVLSIGGNIPVVVDSKKTD